MAARVDGPSRVAGAGWPEPMAGAGWPGPVAGAGWPEPAAGAGWPEPGGRSRVAGAGRPESRVGASLRLWPEHDCMCRCILLPEAKRVPQRLHVAGLPSWNFAPRGGASGGSAAP